MTRSPAGARVGSIARAFFDIGVLDAVSYPLGFVLSRLNGFALVLMFAFVSKLVAGDDTYFEYVVIGIAMADLLDAGLTGLGRQMSQEINTGRLEAYLIEPMPVAALPFGLVLFELSTRLVMSGLVLLAAVAIGADFDLEPGGVAIAGSLALAGVLATMSIAVVGSALRLLTRRTDPILTVYALAARFFAGVFFPIEELPRVVQPLAWLFPHTYVIQTVRGELLPASQFNEGNSLTVAAIGLSAFIFIGLPIAILIFKRAVDYGKQRGLLVGY